MDGLASVERFLVVSTGDTPHSFSRMPFDIKVICWLLKELMIGIIMLVLHAEILHRYGYIGVGKDIYK